MEKTLKRYGSVAENETAAQSSFPFERLPKECQICVFSFLNAIEKARLSSVCKTWNELMVTPRLWSFADFSLLSPCQCGAAGYRRPLLSCDKCVNRCPSDYLLFKKRAYHYVAHLAFRKAILKKLQFQFDLQEDEEVWLKMLLYAINMTNVRELAVVECSWTVTREKPSSLYATEDFLEGKKHERVRAFQKLLKALTMRSEMVHTFRFEFDWSDLSIDLLSSFKHIRHLELYRIWVYKSISQNRINRLLRDMELLESLKLEIWIPYQPGSVHPQYSMMSKSLKCLNIALCKGLFLGSVNLPNLEMLIIARLPWTGPLLPANAIKITCLYEVLSQGAPRLQRINHHFLEEDWRTSCYPALDDQLKHSCYCTKHKKGWAL
ncbi:uncharacterized protein [Ptychodera flava]|uniref:uncharacterized protein n=1 Tax=Ptychodera flava TaxID=63121 RepID=UPI00396AA7A8